MAMILRGLFSVYLLFAAFNCIAGPVRVGLVDQPVDYSHPIISPFKDRSEALRNWQNYNDRRLRFYLDQIDPSAFVEMHEFEDAPLAPTARKNFYLKHPVFTDATHGTATASVILESFKPEDIFFSNIISNDFSVADWKKWIAALRLEVVVLPLDSSGESRSDDKIFIQKLQLMIDEFPNVLFVFAAGNRNLSVEDYPNVSQLKGDNVMKVAAISLDGGAAYFSTSSRENIELGAPGVLIPIAVPGNRYTKLNGTSFAAPLVAASAIREKLRLPNAKAAEIKAEILLRHISSSEDLRFAISGGRYLTPPRQKDPNRFQLADYLPNLCALALGQVARPDWVDSFSGGFMERKFQILKGFTK